MDCLILMTTYNGEKYIQQQVDSIIKQSFLNWKLIIRDDGSSDTTVDLLQKYCKQDQRIELLANNTGKHGAYLNFFTLIEYAHTLKEYDYYFFADQDDIWLPNKLEDMIAFSEKRKSSVPRLVYGDMQVIDCQSKVVYESINKIMGIGNISGLSQFFTHGFLWGCDSMINQALFKAVPVFPLYDPHIDIISHDNYYGKFAKVLGEALYLDEPVIQHRRHGDNETGSYNMKLDPVKVFKRAFLQFDNLAKTHARVYNQTLLTIREMKKNGVETGEINKIKKAIENGGITGAIEMKTMKVARSQKARTAGIYIVMITGAYKKYIYKDI